MANSKYEYVRDFERDDTLLPNTWIVVRIDGRGFHNGRSVSEKSSHSAKYLLTETLTSGISLSDKYCFEKPNDIRALKLMNAATVQVMTMLPDVVIAYGVSDEFSFVFHKSTSLFERRASKLVSTIASTFTAAYVHLWPQFLEGVELTSVALPTFDGRAVCYPSLKNLRDYLSWRQVDCHINNLYNTTFWALVQQGKMSNVDAEDLLKGTVAADKNEILFTRFEINYNNEHEMFRKGSVVFRDYELERAGDLGGETDEISLGASMEQIPSRTQAEKLRKAKAKSKVVIKHMDIIKDDFWEQRPWIVSGKPGRPISEMTT